MLKPTPSEVSTPEMMPSDIEKSGPSSLPPKPPNGGLQAWLAVLGGFCVTFASFGWINCIGIFQSYYETHQLSTYSASTVAWIPSTEAFIMFFFGPLPGFLSDTYGPRIPMLIGSFLHIFGLMMTSLSQSYYQFFLAQSVCSALGCCFLFFPSMAVIPTYFTTHRALALGLVVSGSSIGGVILPIAITRLIPEIGFGWTMRTTAFILLFLLVVGNLTLKPYLPPSGRKFAIRDFFEPLREKAFVALTAAGFATYLGGFLPFTFIVSSGREVGMSAALAGYLVAIVNGSSTFGRIIPAYLGDKYGVFNVMIITTLFGSIFTFAVWLPAHTNAPLIAYAALYGFTSGCTFSIIPAMVASITSDMRKIGARIGTLYALSAVGALVGSPIAGAIVKRQGGDFEGLIVFSGTSIMVGVVLAIVSRWMIVGAKLKAKV
ncbi:monocarboxylate permease-like protein [Phaeosphaeriaceae sp. SRC1lsM3a]|nr:monocarboxylate permease-like protein [Stagonospora sp. SRC1lsM3a]